MEAAVSTGALPAWMPAGLDGVPAVGQLTGHVSLTPARRARRITGRPEDQLALDDVDAIIDTWAGSEPVWWSEGDIARLHLAMLKELNKLQYPKTPLDETLDMIAWVLSDKDDAPLSFARCVQVAKRWPDAWPDESFEGLAELDVDQARTVILNRSRVAVREKLSKLPEWVLDGLRQDFHFVAAMLDADAQWLNRQVVAYKHVQGALKSASCPAWLAEYAARHPEVERDPMHADLAWLSTELQIREELEGVLARRDISEFLREQLAGNAEQVRAKMHEDRGWLDRQIDLDRQIEQALREPQLSASFKAMLRARRQWAMERLAREPGWLRSQVDRAGQQLSLLDAA